LRENGDEEAGAFLNRRGGERSSCERPGEDRYVIRGSLTPTIEK